MGPPLFIVMKGVDYLDAKSLGSTSPPDLSTSSIPELEGHESVDVARGMRELMKSIEADPYVDGPVFGWYEEFANAWLPFNDNVLTIQGAETGGCDVGSSIADDDNNISIAECDDRVPRGSALQRKTALCNALRSFLTDSAEGEPFKHDVVLRFDHGSDALNTTALSSSSGSAIPFSSTSASVSYKDAAESPPCEVVIARLRT